MTGVLLTRLRARTVTGSRGRPPRPATTDRRCTAASQRFAAVTRGMAAKAAAAGLRAAAGTTRPAATGATATAATQRAAASRAAASPMAVDRRQGTARQCLMRARRPPDLAGTAARGTARQALTPRTGAATGPTRVGPTALARRSDWMARRASFLPGHAELWRPGRLRRFSRLRLLGPLGPAGLLQPGRQRSRPRR